MKFFSAPKHSGFTLLELLIVSAIIMMVTVGSLVAFTGFQDRQKALVAAKDVQQLMFSARAKARARETPSGCVKLIGYLVKVEHNQSTLSSVCADPLGTVPLRTVSHENLLISGNADYVFRTLEGGVTSNSTEPPMPITAGSIEFRFGDSGTTYRFSISSTGVISNVDSLGGNQDL